MVQRFPGAALLSQLFRQLIKPTSERIVAYAAGHPRFRKYMLVLPGRIYEKTRRFSVERLKNGHKPFGFVSSSKPIDDEEAMQIGSQLMIEVVIFAMLTLLMSYELLRSQLRAAAVERARQLELEQLASRKTEAQQRLQLLQGERLQLAEILERMKARY